MATQFMPPSSYMAAPPAANYYGYPNGKFGGFSFRKRVERVDWRKISMVDIDNISRTLDFTTLQENIMNITFCNLEAELDVRMVDPNFVKLFKLAQLMIEYLLHSQEFLAGLCASLEEKVKQSELEVEKVKQEVETLQKELADVKKESHKRKKMLIAQQQLLHVGNESYNKCPFCAKAFINNNYLQSHIIRRHSSNTVKKDGYNSVSPDLGVGSESGRNNLEVEIIQLKERLLQYEMEHREVGQSVIHRKEAGFTANQINQNSSVPVNNVEDGEKGRMSDVIMKELRELNAKYQSSQRALRELEARTGSKRSYLGDLEDEIENEKELLQEQRSEVAGLKEQLQQQLDLMKSHMETKLSKQKKKWQKKVHEITQKHSIEIKKLNNALETTSQSQVGFHNHKDVKQQQEVQELLRQSREREKELEVQEKQMEKEIVQAAETRIQKFSTSPRTRKMSKSPRGETLRGSAPHVSSDKGPAAPTVRSSLMYPSDEGTTGFDTGTSSLRSFHADTTPGSTLGQTGTQSLHTLQFLEELRKNPTLAVMRDQLAELLQEQMEKRGIAPNQTGITDEVLKSKLAILSTQRQNHVQKYPDFIQRRDYFDRTSTEEAKKQLRMQSSPWGHPPPDLSLHTSGHIPPSPNGPRSGPPHPQQHLSAQRSTPNSTTPGSQGVSPQHRTQSQIATPQNFKKPLSTGSTTEWASTNYDSGDDDSIEDDPGLAAVKSSVAPGTRLIQSGPARGPGAPTPSPRSQAPKTRLIQSKPMNSDDVDDLDFDRFDRKSSSVPASPRRARPIAEKADIIEKKLENRTSASKPSGGVNVGGVLQGGNGQKKGDSDVESDWDDTEPAPAVVRHPAARGSTDVSNTYGSSAWGSSSKAASTIKDKDHRSTSRSSFVSVTDVSSDEENI